MQIGFNLPNSGPLSVLAAIARITREGETLGYDYLTLTDHVVLPDTKARVTRIPKAASSMAKLPPCGTSNSSVWPPSPRGRSGSGCGAGGPAPPGRADGEDAGDDRRVVGRAAGVGVGAGWLKPEFDALGTPPFPERGAVSSGGNAEIVGDLRAMEEIGVSGVDFDIDRPEAEGSL